MDPLKKAWFNLFARQRFHKFNSRLLRRGLGGLGVADYGPRQAKGERHFLEFLTRSLPQKAVVCDVGAHSGSYALFLAARRPDFVIHAFEPNPVAFAQLQANAGGRYTAHEFALGDSEGEAVLHDPKAEGGSECASLVGAAVKELYSDQPQRTVTVKVRTLDRTLDELALPYVDYLKVDAEGYDLMVLRGAAASIKAGRFGFVQFEFNTMNVFSRTFMHDFYGILPDHRLHRIVQDGLVPLGPYNPVTCELFRLQNIVAVPKDAAAGRKISA